VVGGSIPDRRVADTRTCRDVRPDRLQRVVLGRRSVLGP
jgi:hypothetical protein